MIPNGPSKEPQVTLEFRWSNTSTVLVGEFSLLLQLDSQADNVANSAEIRVQLVPKQRKNIVLS